ncbi:MAG: flagellar hook assembly protein FlgD [Pseudomonadales bacterium]|nr:flagellar hook assembly protein FlgD [Pseudomonadales bacterium]
MTEINSSTSSDIINSLGTKTNAATEEQDLGKDAFLQLMIAQLQNQDPLSPAKNEDFIAQLAQFSSVEGIQNINSSIEELATAFRSSQALQASSLVGRQVQVSADTATLSADGPVRGTIDLATSSANIKLYIEGPDGQVVRTQDIGTQERGAIDFTWDGTNESGLRVADGAYRVYASGLVDGEIADLPVAIGANVNSVTIGQNDSMILNIEGVGAVPLSEVSRFL